MRRTSLGKRLALTPRDFAIFRALSRYRYLRSTYLHRFSGGASETRFKERLGDLFHEGFLDRPSKQWEFYEARLQPVVYALGKRAQACSEVGDVLSERCTYLAHGAERQFRHATQICDCLASIELAAIDHQQLRFVPWSEILARAPKTTQRLATPFHLPVGGRFVVPDAIFGLEYIAGAQRSYRFFALEVDRGTMPIARSNPAQTSLLAKYAAYADMAQAHIYKVHLGLPNLMVLTVVPSVHRLEASLAALGSAARPEFLFKEISPTIAREPMADLLTQPWRRAGRGSFFIDRPA